MIWKWRSPAAAPRADLAILEALESQTITRSQLKRLIDGEKVTLNGKPIKANIRLKEGDEIQIDFPAPEPSELVPEDRPLEILFEDEHLLVVNKPPGLTVHPSPTQMKGTLVHALLHHIQDLSGIGGVLRPGIVHRIDKDTSGALVITKTDAAHVKLAEVFSKHDIERCYWALCYGAPPFSKSPKKIESLIGRNPNDRKKMSMTVKTGRSAITYYSCLKEYSIPQKKPFASWLNITLETGRTHQIRVHLTGEGYSILGDPVYGTPTQNHPKWQALPNSIRTSVQTLPGQALHARVLGFTHPITKQPLRFEADPPPEFKAVLEELEKFSHH